MEKYFFAIIISAILIQACAQSSLPFNSDEPRNRSFRYYKERTINDSGGLLVLNRNYVSRDSPCCRIIRFFQNGSLNMLVANNPDLWLDDSTYKEYLTGVERGFYKVRGDTIFFSTKIHYNHTEKFYIGLISLKQMTVYYKSSRQDGTKKTIYRVK